MRTSAKLMTAVAALSLLGGCGIFKGDGKRKTPILGERVPILSAENDVTVDPSLAAVQVLLPPPVANADWTQPGGNEAKAMGHLALAASPSRVWTARIPGGTTRVRLAAAPVVAGGRLYVMDVDGTVVWTQAGSVESQGVFGVAAPASAQGTIVAGFSSGELNAYRYENGRSLWADSLSRTSASTSVSSLADIDAEPVIDAGRAYAVGQGGRMVALEVTSGQRLWEQNLAGISTPAVAGEWLFVVTDDARLLCVARGSGKVRWMHQLPRYKNEKKKKGPILWVGPLLAGNRLVLANSEGQLVYASAEDGTVSATVEASSNPIGLSPVVADSTLYLLDDSGTISAWR